jgi:hypothetical protein
MNHTISKALIGTLLSAGLSIAGLGLAAGTAQAFNPQPDPPGKPLSPGIIQGFNPQPDPPGVIRVVTHTPNLTISAGAEAH